MLYEVITGLTLRGVAFDFRVKAKDEHKATWDFAFFAGSLLASFAQGYMLGRVVTGFTGNIWSYLFACLIGLGMSSGYALLSYNFV